MEKDMYEEEGKCKWCGLELPDDDWIEYCPDTNCEYDGEKWRMVNYE